MALCRRAKLGHVCLTAVHMVVLSASAFAFCSHIHVTAHSRGVGKSAGGVRIPIGELLECPDDQLSFTLYNKTKQPSGTVQASTMLALASPHLLLVVIVFVSASLDQT